jgi:ABC-type sulfate transport system permease component
MTTAMCVAQETPVNWVRLSQPLPRRVIGALIGLPVALLIIVVGLALLTPGADYAAQGAKARAIPATTVTATAGARTDVYLPGKGAGCKW